MGTQDSPIHLPLASASSCTPSFFPSHVLPPGWTLLGVLCAWTVLSPSLQALPSPRVPCCPHSRRASRTAASTFILSGLPRVCSLGSSLGLWICGKWDKGHCRGLPGGPGPPSSSLKQWASHWPPGQALGQGRSFPSLTPGAGWGRGSHCGWPRGVPSTCVALPWP